MRDEIYDEKEKDEFNKKQLLLLKQQRNLLREESTKLEKILKEEEEKNFKINKKYFKINAKLEAKEQEAQEINQNIEDMKYKNYFNYYDKEFTDKLENRVKMIFDEHFSELNIDAEEEKGEYFREEKFDRDLTILFEYESNVVPIKLEGRNTFNDIKELIGSYFFLSEDLIYFKDAAGNLLMPWLKIRETLFSDYFAYFKNYTPKVYIVLRNDLKFDDVIMENLKETQGDTDPFIEAGVQQQTMERKNNPNTILGIPFGDENFLRDMAKSLNNTKPGIENIFKLGVNVLFLVVIILFSERKIQSKNLLESVAVTNSLNSYFEIIYKERLPALDLTNYTTPSEIYGAKLDFIVMEFTNMLYNHGYAPFYKGLIYQTKAKNISCAFNDVLKFDYHMCVDPRLEEQGVINNDDSQPQNVWNSIYGFSGYIYEVPIIKETQLNELNQSEVTFKIDLPKDWLNFQTNSVNYIINYINPYNNFIVTYRLITKILFPDYRLTYYKIDQDIFLGNYEGFSDESVYYELMMMVFSYFLFVFLWLEIFKVFGEKSQNPLVLEFKYERLKKTQGHLLSENDKDDPLEGRKREKVHYYIWKARLWGNHYYFAFVFPSIFWITTLVSLIYIQVRNGQLDDNQNLLQNIDSQNLNYNNLLSVFSNGILIYENIDGIITIIAFFSFIHYLSKVSNFLRCYFQMIIHFTKETSAIALIIGTFIFIMSIIFIFHTLGGLGMDYSDFLNNFLLFLGILQKNGFWAQAKYTGQQNSGKNDLLFGILTAVIFFFAVFLSSFLILAILVSINAQYVHDTKIDLENERKESLRRTQNLVKQLKENRKTKKKSVSGSPRKSTALATS